jgi:pimeloyl-ACP methyl ester carboxylesterase
MTMRRTITTGLAALVAFVVVSPVAWAQTTDSSQAVPAPLSWKTCKDLAPQWPKDGGTKAECTMVEVPMDHAKPDGRKLDIAVSRLPATDQAHRKGVIVLNPGGPGGRGTDMPQMMAGSRLGALNKEFDLVGFDPRGVGFSGSVSCSAVFSVPGLNQPATKADFQSYTDRRGQAFANCAAADLEFFHNLSTTSIAQDVDDIRQALGERKISFYGISWGSGLGAAYRSMFDQHVDRMTIESVMPAHLDTSEIDAAESAAAEADAHRFAEWMSHYDDVLHFGKTGEQVYLSLLALRDQLNAHPHQVGTGKTAYTLDGSWVLGDMAQTEDQWTYTAGALADLRDGKDPAPRPQPETATGTGAQGSGLNWDEKFPVSLNRLVEQAVACNDATGTRDLDEAWNQYEAIQKRYPVGGAFQAYVGGCVHWPFEGKNPDYRPGTSPLQLVGHRYEAVTPYPLAVEMWRQIGGSLLTVDNDAHASLSTLPCAEKAVHFFETGQPSDDSCPGAPIAEPTRG